MASAQCFAEKRLLPRPASPVFEETGRVKVGEQIRGGLLIEVARRTPRCAWRSTSPARGSTWCCEGGGREVPIMRRPRSGATFRPSVDAVALVAGERFEKLLATSGVRGDGGRGRPSSRTPLAKARNMIDPVSSREPQSGVTRLRPESFVKIEGFSVTVVPSTPRTKSGLLSHGQPQLSERLVVAGGSITG